MYKISSCLKLLEDREIKRKVIHVASILIPLIFSYISFTNFILLFLFSYAIWIFLDFQRRKNRPLQELLERILGDVFRPGEAKSFSGATHMGLGILITCVFFEAQTVVMALTILAICDSVASIVGERYGAIKVSNKSLEGSAGFFLSGLVIVCAFVWGLGYKEHFLWENIIALAAATIAELYSSRLKINDNVLIPVVFAITVALLESVV